MRMMLDSSIKVINGISESTGLDILQLRTPLTMYRPDGSGVIKYGLDNGAYSEFRTARFTRMAKEAMDDDRCLWIAVPDYPFCAYSTIGMFNQWRHVVKSKRAFVLQDDITIYSSLIPWDEIVAVFVGGSDRFKDSRYALDLAREAKERGKWVHVGRVNTKRRIHLWEGYCDSFDGSGISRFRHMRNSLVASMKSLERSKKKELWEYGSNK